MARCKETKADYNKRYYKEHVDYYISKGKEYYERNREDILLRKALKRYQSGIKVGDHLVEKMRLKKMIT